MTIYRGSSRRITSRHTNTINTHTTNTHTTNTTNQQNTSSSPVITHHYSNTSYYNGHYKQYNSNYYTSKYRSYQLFNLKGKNNIKINTTTLTINGNNINKNMHMPSEVHYKIIDIHTPDNMLSSNNIEEYSKDGERNNNFDYNTFHPTRKTWFLITNLGNKYYVQNVQYKKSKGNGGSTAGSTAGIVIGVLLVSGVFIFGFIWLLKRRRKK